MNKKRLEELFGKGFDKLSSGKRSYSMVPKIRTPQTPISGGVSEEYHPPLNRTPRRSVRMSPEVEISALEHARQILQQRNATSPTSFGTSTSTVISTDYVVAGVRRGIVAYEEPNEPL